MREGWQILAIGEVCQLVNGGTPKSGVSEYWGGSLSWITPAEMGKRQDPYIGSTQRTISELGLKNSSARMIPPNSVILSSRAPIGHLAINTVPMAFNQGCKGLIPRGSIQYKFLYYYLLGSVEYLDSLGTGTTFKELSSGKLQEVKVPVPPLPEQRRIVALLDEAFASLAAAKANAERNLRNARAVFEGNLEAVFNERGLGWEEKRLGDIVTRLTNGYVGPTRNIYQDQGIPYLLARHVRDNRLAFDGRTFVSNEFNQKNKKSILKAGDVLLVQSGHIGHSAVVAADHEGHNCHAMIVMTPVVDALSGSYLSLFFGSSRMKKRFQEIRSGSTVPHLTCGEVRELMIPLPDLVSQQRVVGLALELEAETIRLAHIYERKLAALEELKKSLLQQAFNGEL